MKAVITIPIYKIKPSISEVASFERCLVILKNYDIIIFTHKELDVSFYNKLAKNHGKTIKYTYFEKKYFDGIWGYNELMLSKIFYDRFVSYDYLLIYQLDAWVFEDKLLEWCQKGYDYIGAPWWEHLQPRVGNGGFSLRRISFFRSVFRSKKRFYSISHLLGDVTWYNPISIIKFFLKVLGVHNTFGYFNKLWIRVFEDQFWCRFLYGSQFQLNIPGLEEAALFSIDISPEEMYEINGHVMPFGCHAFQKEENWKFWKNYINIEL